MATAPGLVLVRSVQISHQLMAEIVANVVKEWDRTREPRPAEGDKAGTVHVAHGIADYATLCGWTRSRTRSRPRENLLRARPVLV